MDELISKEVVIDTLKAVRDLVWEVDIPSPTVPEYIEHHEQMQAIMKNIDVLTDKIIKMPSVQPETHEKRTETHACDCISREAALDAINHICPVDTEYDCTLLDRVDVRLVLSDLPSAQPEIDKDINVPVNDCISRQWLVECVNEGWIKFDTEKDESRFIHLVRDIAPSAQPEWIPCSERMPEYPFGCLVTVWDTNPITMDELENILPYFVGWDGEQWNDGEGDQCPFEVIAWWPVPEPFKEDRDD